MFSCQLLSGFPKLQLQQNGWHLRKISASVQIHSMAYLLHQKPSPNSHVSAITSQLFHKVYLNICCLDLEFLTFRVLWELYLSLGKQNLCCFLSHFHWFVFFLSSTTSFHPQKLYFLCKLWILGQIKLISRIWCYNKRLKS